MAWRRRDSLAGFYGGLSHWLAHGLGHPPIWLAPGRPLARIGSGEVDTCPAAMIGPAACTRRIEVSRTKPTLQGGTTGRRRVQGFPVVGGTTPNSRTAEHEACQSCCYLWARVHPRCETELLRVYACPSMFFFVRFSFLSLSLFLLLLVFSFPLLFFISIFIPFLVFSLLYSQPTPKSSARANLAGDHLYISITLCNQTHRRNTAEPPPTK